jgi:hypothetical protein
MASSSSSSAPTAKKGYRVGDLFLKPAVNYLTNSSPKDPYYVGKLLHQVSSATALPVLNSLTNSSPEDPYHFGKLTKQIASGVYKTVLKSNKLSITAYKNPLVDTIPLEYIMIINRPYADHTYIGIKSGILYMGKHSVFTPSCVIRDIVDNNITTTVYEDPVLSTKESPHYAAAMIIGDRMLAIVWVDKMRYFVDTSSRCSLEHTVYSACTKPNPVSSKFMTITRI